MRATVAKVATLGLLAGCGLARSGLLAGSTDPPASLDASTTTVPPSDATGSVTPPGNDASVSTDGGPSVSDAPSAADVVDATSVDASDVADAACPPPSPDAAVTIATKIAPAPKIDGDLSDWGCGPWTELNAANAAFSRLNGQSLSGLFAVRWDSAGLYLGAHIAVPMVQGDDATNPYNNDAVELYVSGDSPLTGDYDQTSHQYIVDWKNLAVDYGPLHYPPNQQVTNPPHFTSQAKKVADGWQVEIAVEWAALVKGKAPTAGASIGVDVQLDDGDGTALDTLLLETLTHSTTCGCHSCCCGQPPPADLPNCDTLAFGTVTLQ